jgi:transposase
MGMTLSLLLKSAPFVLNEQQALIELKDKQLAEQEENVEWLQERLNLLLAKRYQHSSEKDNDKQLSLLDKQELDAAIAEAQRQLDDAQAAMDAADQDLASTDPSDTQKRGKTTAGSSTEPHRPKRNKLPEHLRRVMVDVDVSDEQKQAMGDQWVQVGWETSEQLAVQEREYFVKQIRRAKYIRVCADEQGQNTQGIKVAPTLPVMLPRAIADASLLAKIVTGKFVDALSLNRECKVLEREGVHCRSCSMSMGRSNRCGIWMRPRCRCLMNRNATHD